MRDSRSDVARRGRVTSALRVVIALCFAVFAASAYGSDTTVASERLYHSAWTDREGAPANITDVVQAADGWLWVASHGGLDRFDGVQFERFRPRQGPSFLSDDVSALLALPDGGLWIGYGSGGASLLRDEVLTNYPANGGLGTHAILQLARDRDGMVWAATDDGLKRFDGRQWASVGADWGFAEARAKSLYVDRQGTLWVSPRRDLKSTSSRCASSSTVTTRYGS
jgi:ligand-binding sensor domain-containing protein